MSHSLSGVFPVFQTPYLADESIDAETLEREIAWLEDLVLKRRAIISAKNAR